MTAFTTTPSLLDPATVHQQLDQILLVDVREPAEFRGEHIAGSVLVPLSGFRADLIPSSDKPLVLMCQSGNRTRQATQLLSAAGISTIQELEGGLNAWKAAGLPTVKAQKAAISIMRQVQITAGSLVVLGTVLGAFVNPAWLVLSAFVGSGLVFAGVSNTCAMAMLLARMPWNR